jgi:phosphatidylserine/phosphatidylglycerophosphate/cardiolipin synthase-like enzyme
MAKARVPGGSCRVVPGGRQAEWIGIPSELSRSPKDDPQSALLPRHKSGTASPAVEPKQAGTAGKCPTEPRPPVDKGCQSTATQAPIRSLVLTVARPALLRRAVQSRRLLDCFDVHVPPDQKIESGTKSSFLVGGQRMSAIKGTLSVRAYRGDFKTLLAFTFSDKRSAKNLAGFTLQCMPKGKQPYYLQNTLRFQTPGDHAQDPKEPANSSINAPMRKFRWLHVPGSVHQGTQPFKGRYTYTVTPRYFDDKKSLRPIDPALSVAVDVDVEPFQKQGLALGFTRGFTQSQAFVHHFGLNALIRPKTKDLLFDTRQQSGTNAAGEQFTFADAYKWLGFTARAQIFGVLNEVLTNESLHLDVFAYDLNEPDVINILLRLAEQGRIRIILDNSSLHHNAKSPKPEDHSEKLFIKAAKGKAAILRGKFGRYAHDKVFIVSNSSGAIKVLTGSTNFSVTGLYVNSNHVLIFDDPDVARTYAELFEEAWKDQLKRGAFAASSLSTKSFALSSAKTPRTEITFAPHQTPFATTLLQDIAKRIAQEGTREHTVGSVLFAVMQIDKGTSPVYTALRELHKQQHIFSYGISDSPGGIYLYSVGKTTGVLVTGKPVNTQLPPPFNQVPNIGGVGHQVHHKFVVCGFNGDSPVVYCGSSNLALGGERLNGDNLLAIHDSDVATAFALEALALVDHFSFLDGLAKGPKASKPKSLSASKQQDAATAGWFLSTDDKWAKPYFDPRDLHCVDRELFGSV